MESKHCHISSTNVNDYYRYYEDDQNMMLLLMLLMLLLMIFADNSTDTCALQKLS